MEFGVYIAPTPDARVFASLAAEVEDRGFDSVFLPEHTHVPVDIQTDQPGGGMFAHDTFDGGDPFIHLAAAAMRTERVLLGTGAALLPQHDPITLAKIASTLDVMSQGRVLLGLGAGWSRKELERHGVRGEDRWPVFREKLLAMKAIWNNDVAEFHGEHVDFDAVAQWPKPVQPGGVPVNVCANGPTALAIAAEAADGWQPHLIPGRPPLPFREKIAELREATEKHGRAELPITFFVFNNDPDPAQVAEFEEAGVSRCVYRIAPREPDEIKARLDAAQRVATSFG